MGNMSLLDFLQRLKWKICLRGVGPHRQRVGMQVEARAVMRLGIRGGIEGFENDGVVDEGAQAEAARIGRPSRDGEIASICSRELPIPLGEVACLFVVSPHEVS